VADRGLFLNFGLAVADGDDVAQKALVDDAANAALALVRTADAPPS
jgi:hypothetical protein